jgi:hypothetical protein
MSSVLPLTLGQSGINFDNSSATGIITINGTSLTEVDVANIPPVRSLTWNNLYNLRDNLGAVQNAPNTTTLRVENTLRLTDTLGNTRNISTLSNPATTIDTNSTNGTGTFYPLLTDGAGTGRQLFIDDTTGPFTYQPSTNTMTLSGTGTSLLLSANRLFLNITNSVATFTTGTLTLPLAANTSLQSFTFTMSANITAVSFGSGFVRAGKYTLFITGHSSSNFTIAVGGSGGLGANIFTSWSSPSYYYYCW